MKKLIINLRTVILLTCLACTANLLAQDKAEQLKEIRKAYAEAKQEMSENGKEGRPRMDITIAMNDGMEVSEDFIINDETELNFFFKRIHQSGESDLFEPACYFIVEKTASNGHTCYREMLFDPFSSHLLFSYMKAETHAGYVIESRYYYDDMGNLIEEKHKVGNEETTAEAQNWSSGGGDQTMAMSFLWLFNTLMQQKNVAAESYTAIASADKAERIKHIRAMYAEAMKKVEVDAQSQLPRNIQIDIHDQEDPDMPPQTDVLKFWFERTKQDDVTHCYFMSSTCTLGDHHVYSEYLFEPKSSRLLFCFSKQAQNDGPALEWRYYFDDNGQCIETKGQDEKYGPGFADKKSAKVWLELFNMLMNPE